MILMSLLVAALAASPAIWTPYKGVTVTDAGAAAHLLAPPGGVVEIPLALDWTTLGSLHIDITSKEPVTIEIVAAEADRRAWFWRKVDLAAGPSSLDLPLAWFRWSDGARVPSWEKVDRLALRFRGPAEVEVGAPVLAPGSPFLGVEAVASVAPAPLRCLRSPVTTLLWSAPDLDSVALVEHLERVSVWLTELAPWLPAPTSPPILVVLEDDRAFRDYVVELAQGFNATVDPPEHDGFTLQGIAVGSWEPASGTLRPTYTHEYAHAWLAARAHLSSSEGDWLQEGVASLAQLRFHPQDDLASIVCEGLDKPGYRMPLADLVSGRRLPTNRYWQAATVVEHLLTAHGEDMPALLAAFHEAGSVNLQPHLGPVLGADVASFEREWMEATAGRYCIAGDE